MIFDIFEHFLFFWVTYDLPEVREVSRKLPGARGSVATKYGPVASHGDPIQPRNYTFFEFPNSVVLLSGSEIDDMASRHLLGAQKLDYVDTTNLLGRQKSY